MRQSTNYAIFLGAGASAADGAPIQSQLFKEYFKSIKENNEELRYDYEKEISLFFQKMFSIDYLKDDLETTSFPTFEEALGILDLADAKNESFRNFANINLDSDSGKIKFLRLYLVFLMAKIITEKLQTGKRNHRKLIRILKHKKLLNETCFITTNYDILCDNALLDDGKIESINYGFDFRNYYENTIPIPNQYSPKLFKLHGSLNWLFCPTCNTVKQTPFEKGVYDLIVDPNQSYCNRCHSFYSPIIVPPTFYKDLSNVYLNMVWNKAEIELTYVKHLIFCGYSFPDADIHIKYLLKRIQRNRRTDNLKITVINNHTGKSKAAIIEEKERYIRFLGSKVDYTKLSFEEFSVNPELIIK